MPGFVIHIAVAEEYIKKHKNEKENRKEFIDGTIYPDLISPKSLSHYGKSPAYSNLKLFLENNDMSTSFNRGNFLHLLTDYLFYNQYIEIIPKEGLYNDYDIINEKLIENYKITYIPEKAKKSIFFKNGEVKVLTYELACKVIDEISQIDLDSVCKEILQNSKKWSTYKKLV